MRRQIDADAERSCWEMFFAAFSAHSYCVIGGGDVGSYFFSCRSRKTKQYSGRVVHDYMALIYMHEDYPPDPWEDVAKCGEMSSSFTLYTVLFSDD